MRARSLPRRATRWLRRFLPGKWLALCVAVWLAPGAHAEPVYLVDLDKNLTLTAIFESGLRPLNVRGLENKKCEIRPAKTVAFKAGGPVTPGYLAAWEFTFNAAGRLTSVTGYSEQAWSDGEAWKAMAPMEKVLGGDPARMLAFLQGYPRTSPGGDMWGNRFLGPDGVRVGYYFRHSMQRLRPFLVTFYIDWKRPDFELRKGNTPLQSPPGYESFEMNPGKRTQPENPARPAKADRPETPRTLLQEAGDLISRRWPWLILLATGAWGVRRWEQAILNKRSRKPRW